MTFDNNPFNGADGVPQMPQPQIDVETLPTVTCDKCGCKIFKAGLVLKKVSPLQSQSGQEEVLPVQVFACAACNHVNDSMGGSLLREKKIL